MLHLNRCFDCSSNQSI